MILGQITPILDSFQKGGEHWVSAGSRDSFPLALIRSFSTFRAFFLTAVSTYVSGPPLGPASAPPGLALAPKDLSNVDHKARLAMSHLLALVALLGDKLAPLSSLSSISWEGVDVHSFLGYFCHVFQGVATFVWSPFRGS